MNCCLPLRCGGRSVPDPAFCQASNVWLQNSRRRVKKARRGTGLRYRTSHEGNRLPRRSARAINRSSRASHLQRQGQARPLARCVAEAGCAAASTWAPLHRNACALSNPGRSLVTMDDHRHTDEFASLHRIPVTPVPSCKTRRRHSETGWRPCRFRAFMVGGSTIIAASRSGPPPCPTGAGPARRRIGNTPST